MIAQKVQNRDSFSFALFYDLDSEGTRAMIYEDAGGEIFAEPTLHPIVINLSEISIEPAISYTAQEIKFMIRIDSNRYDLLDSPYLLARWAAGTYSPLFSYLHDPKA